MRRVAVLVDILEELLSGQVLHALDDPRDAAVDHLQLPLLAGLALEGEAQRRAFDPHMPVAERRQAEAAVVARVGGIADADHACCRAATRPSPAPVRARGRAAAGRPPPRAGAAAAPARTPGGSSISLRPGRRSSSRGSGTACGRERPCRSPARGRSPTGRSRHRSRPAGSRARGCARGSRHPRRGARPARCRRSPSPPAGAGFPAAHRCHRSAPPPRPKPRGPDPVAAPGSSAARSASTHERRTRRTVPANLEWPASPSVGALLDFFVLRPVLAEHCRHPSD